MHEIEQRSVIGKGEHMLESGHPAPQSIEVSNPRLQPAFSGTVISSHL